ncbi:MAG: UDP-4-amino-4,6-dideoxy-N-acetyl-beta-L-altrosamine transaminase [Nitrospirae bacterium]|nr:UDP-4-amino-4,6-dideoxy-N-acetyl-beta-L-altrosamine transaminase [Nitrospirota bacterium]
MDFIPYGRQSIDDEDIRAVIEALRSDWLTQGPKVIEFERLLADYCGAKYAVAVSSGTAALHIACLAAGIKEGDEVITSPISFVATSNSVLYCGGKPVFADIDKDTFNIDVAEIKKKITRYVKAIIPVHFAGLPCEIEEINKIAEEHGLILIEDACHALGAKWMSQSGSWNKIGSSSHSDMTVMSFHPVKHITTGEGGAVLTNRWDLYNSLLKLRSHGITKRIESFRNKCAAFGYSSIKKKEMPNQWYYEMHELGFNYRLTDIQSALGISQLKKIDSFVYRRQEIAEQYNNEFSSIRYVKHPYKYNAKQSSYHLYPLLIDFKKLGFSRNEFIEELKKNKIGSQVHYIPIHLQPFYRDKFGYKEGDFKIAEAFYAQELSMPIYSGMSDADVERVVKAFKGIFNV